jgi:hypothetical protein
MSTKVGGSGGLQNQITALSQNIEAELALVDVQVQAGEENVKEFTHFKPKNDGKTVYEVVQIRQKAVPLLDPQGKFQPNGLDSLKDRIEDAKKRLNKDDIKDLEKLLNASNGATRLVQNFFNAPAVRELANAIINFKRLKDKVTKSAPVVAQLKTLYAKKTTHAENLAAYNKDAAPVEALEQGMRALKPVDGYSTLDLKGIVAVRTQVGQLIAAYTTLLPFAKGMKDVGDTTRFDFVTTKLTALNKTDVALLKNEAVAREREQKVQGQAAVAKILEALNGGQFVMDNQIGNAPWINELGLVAQLLKDNKDALSRVDIDLSAIVDKFKNELSDIVGLFVKDPALYGALLDNFIVKMGPVLEANARMKTAFGPVIEEAKALRQIGANILNAAANRKNPALKPKLEEHEATAKGAKTFKDELKELFSKARALHRLIDACETFDTSAEQAEVEISRFEKSISKAEEAFKGHSLLAAMQAVFVELKAVVAVAKDKFVAAAKAAAQAKAVGEAPKTTWDKFCEWFWASSVGRLFLWIKSCF